MKTVSISVRRGKRKDAVALAQIREIAWRFAYTGIIPGPALEKIVHVRLDSWWRWALTVDCKIDVVEVADIVVGYTSWGPCRSRQLPAKAEIYECYILPEYHGMGLGTRLFEKTRRDARAKYGQGCIVWALEDNEVGCRFYAARGGEEIARTQETLGGATLEKIAYLWR